LANKFQNSEVIARILGAIDEIPKENYSGIAVSYPPYKLLKKFDLAVTIAKGDRGIGRDIARKMKIGLTHNLCK
jgi:hypothetical protein